MSRGSIFIERRERLRALLPGKTILLFSGPFHHRNIPGVIHPFRANSHFLHFFGQFPPNAVGVITATESIAFVRHSSRDEKFWEGEEDLGKLKTDSGIDRLEPIERFPELLSKLDQSAIRTIPPHRIDQRQELSRLFGREVGLEGVDRELVDAVIELRLIQDPFAESELRRAGTAARGAAAAVTSHLSPGKYEWEVRAELEREIRSRNMDLSFPPIVTNRGDILHNRSYDNRLESGDILLVDFGTETADGYASDVTRVYPVSGTFLPEQQAIFDLVSSANRQAIASVKPGVRFRDLHLQTCKLLTEGLIEIGLLKGSAAEIVSHGAHAVFFPHGLGHLLGLDVHDMEDLGDIAGYEHGRKRDPQFGLSFLRLDRDLKPGMALTIEPGLYFIDPILNDAEFLEPFKKYLVWDKIEQFRRKVRGVRIEDDVLVTTSGADVLTK